MSLTQFTPGPWSIVPYGDGDSLVIHSSDENRVCFMATHGGSRKSWETIQANASLIAAAPELYEALKALADDYATISPKYHSTDVYAAARAALSKATGDAQ